MFVRTILCNSLIVVLHFLFGYFVNSYHRLYTAKLSIVFGFVQFSHKTGCSTRLRKAGRGARSLPKCINVNKTIQK